MGKQIPARAATRGLTLIELVAGLAIAGILLTAGIPGMTHLIRQNRMAVNVNSFVATLNYARSEAVKRGHRVVICQSREGKACESAGGWHPGWIVFADANGNREYDDEEPMLLVGQGVHPDIEITSSRRRRIVYQATGTAGGTNGTYVFCMPEAPHLKRAVILSNTGRVRLSDTGPKGEELDCG